MKHTLFLILAAFLMSGCVVFHHPTRCQSRDALVYTKVTCGDYVVEPLSLGIPSGKGFVMIHMADSTVRWIVIIDSGKKDNTITQVLDAPDGSTYVLGWYSDTLKLGMHTLFAKSKDVFLAKILGDGTVAWLAGYGGPEDDACTFISSLNEKACIVKVYLGTYDYLRFPCVCEEHDPRQQLYTGTFKSVSFDPDDGSLVAGN